MKILHLTLTRKWFDLIASGSKTAEFREGKPYWRKRLLHSNGVAIRYDEIHFRNGYSRNAPFMRVEWQGLSNWDFGRNHDGVLLGPHGEEISHGMLQIDLGRVLEVRNWEGIAVTNNRLID